MSHDQEHLPDADNWQAGFIHGNDYTLPYTSPWSRIYSTGRDMLAHMNCNYLSTPGTPATLLALKQHAQSLAILIAALNPSVEAGEIDAANFAQEGTRNFKSATAFDWLQDLNRPYYTDDPNHHKPLNALVNEVEAKHDVLGTKYHCPLKHDSAARKPNTPRLPYANHHSLVMHANECLERLDHEFAATGGLLSLLQDDDEGANRKELDFAKNTLLGQWLSFTSHLVVRMHELEISYGNSLDALAKTAVIPLQHLSQQGPDLRSAPRNLAAYPQDRWILANAGDDVLSHLHDMFDQREALLEEKDNIWRGAGVMYGGDNGPLHYAENDGPENRGDTDYARGIVPIDINTRYYRLRGHGNRSTVFVIPAYEHHPGVQHTREMEIKPTVVSVVEPKFPATATALEAKWADKVERGQTAEREAAKARAENERMKKEIQVLQHELERESAVNEAVQKAFAADNPLEAMAAEVTELKQQLARIKAQEVRAGR